MATRQYRLSEFNQGPAPDRAVEVLCEDHNGTYVLPTFANGETVVGITPRAVRRLKQVWSGGGEFFAAMDIEHRILDAIQGHRPRNVAEGYGEVSIKAQAAAHAKMPRYKLPP